jgi:hypothetical protein
MLDCKTCDGHGEVTIDNDALDLCGGPDIDACTACDGSGILRCEWCEEPATGFVVAPSAHKGCAICDNCFEELVKENVKCNV